MNPQEPHRTDRAGPSSRPAAGGKESAGAAPLLESVVIDRAAALARAGRLVEAEALLAPLAGADTTNPAVLDLLAKAKAQQGKLEEARILWQRALALDPVNDKFRLALRRCGARGSRPGILGIPWAVAAIALVLLVAAMAVRDMNQLKDQLRGIQQELARLRATHPDEARTTEAVLPDLRESVGAALRDHPVTTRLGLELEQHGTTVSLIGEAPDVPTRYLVEQVAGGVAGVEVLDLRRLTLPTQYVVRRGDTLWRIRDRVYGTSSGWQSLAEANGLSPPYMLVAGQRLTLPQLGAAATPGRGAERNG